MVYSEGVSPAALWAVLTFLIINLMTFRTSRESHIVDIKRDQRPCTVPLSRDEQYVHRCVTGECCPTVKREYKPAVRNVQEGPHPGE